MILLSVGAALAGDLIYKTEKSVENPRNAYVEIAEFGTGKHKTLPVAVSADPVADFAFVKIEAIEGAGAVFVDEIKLSKDRKSGWAVVTAPRKRLRVSANQSATYKTFVWSE